jgi:hypothetical protein
MLFDGPPAELPTATLVPSGLPTSRQIAGDLDRWLSRRWAWLAPRAIPLLVATLGLVATLASVKYAGLWARSSRLSLGVHARTADTPPHELGARRGRIQAIELVIRPLNLSGQQHDHYIVLTIDPPETP